MKSYVYLVTITLLVLLVPNLLFSESIESSSGTPIIEPQIQTYVFVCDNKASYTVRTSEVDAWVFRPQGTLHLYATPSKTGTTYAGKGFAISIDGQRATFISPYGKQLSCHNDTRQAIWEKAKLDGADFRAVGNEPGWNLVIMAASRIILIADYGASRIEVPLPRPETNHETRTTRWDAGELILEITGKPCRDSMSDEQFESTVTVTTKTATLRGCGRALH
jgi:uncharacterized membrane protein